MSAVRPEPAERDVIAVACADLHLQGEAPKAARAERGAEWYEATGRHLDQLAALQKEYNVPVLVAGDLFDRWDNSSELVNFLLDRLPFSVYAIPGNHDLRHHNYKDLKVTSYWTLVRANRVVDVRPDLPQHLSCGAVVYGFPWGTPVEPNEFPPHTFGIHVALVHRYLWTPKSGHKGADDKDRLRNVLKDLAGYDTVVVGDNHTTFGFNLDRKKPKLPAVLNPGSFMRRHTDQRGHRPCVGLIKKDGRVTIHYLDCSRDKFAEDVGRDDGPNVRAFARKAERLAQGDGADFGREARRVLRSRGVHARTRRFGELALEEGG